MASVVAAGSGNASAPARTSRSQEHGERRGEQHPAQEVDALAGRGLEQADGDEVGRAADRREQPADRRRVGDGQEEADAKAARAPASVRGARPAPDRGRAGARVTDQTERHRQHHRGGRGVAHPSRDRQGEDADAQPRAAGGPADRGHREQALGEPSIEPVMRHRRAEHEAADEEEHGRAARTARTPAARCHAGDHRERGSDHRGDRERDRLGDPPHHDQQHDRGEAVRLDRERRHRREPGEQERDRTEEESDGAAALLEALLRGGERFRRRRLVRDAPARADQSLHSGRSLAVGSGSQKLAITLIR